MDKKWKRDKNDGCMETTTATHTAVAPIKSEYAPSATM